MSRVNPIYLLMVALLLLLRPALSGEIARIGDPTVLKGVKYKVVVLEYDSPERNKWGRDISQMIAQEILGSISGVLGVGVVNLRQPEERVRLSYEVIEREAHTQKALVVIWGEFYSDSSNVYVHSHLRIIPNEEFPPAALGLKYRYYPAENASMEAHPPTLHLNFAPIKVSLETLRNLQGHFQRTVTVRSAPRRSAEVLGRLKYGDKYFLLEKRGRWTRIQTASGLKGWIAHATLGDQSELQEVRAVVTMAQGILQYIAGNFAVAEQSLQRYMDEFAYRQDNMNRAFGHILLGNARLRREGFQMHVPEEEKISLEYIRAAYLLPNNPAPVNHLTILNMLKLQPYTPNPELLSQLERRLIRVIRSENDFQSLKNLQVFYQICANDPTLWDNRIPPENFRQKIRKLNEIKARLEQRN